MNLFCLSHSDQDWKIAGLLVRLRGLARLVAEVVGWNGMDRMVMVLATNTQDTQAEKETLHVKGGAEKVIVAVENEWITCE